ncbi:MAG: hypothetical protein LBT01_05535 [Spirochaetaceae bacterium]|nr:hypothetical protein [Spirochaetaceae bacterium]
MERLYDYSCAFASKGKAFSVGVTSAYAHTLAAMLLATHSTVTASQMNVHTGKAFSVSGSMRYAHTLAAILLLPRTFL